MHWLVEVSSLEHGIIYFSKSKLSGGSGLDVRHAVRCGTLQVSAACLADSSTNGSIRPSTR